MQGCGKTTIAMTLAWIYEEIDVLYDSFSLDNFYLTFQEREVKLSKKYYWFRGPPGSHSVELISKFLSDWKSCSFDELSIPLFDKSLKQG
jgi:D-glycerate 3-kinase